MTIINIGGKNRTLRFGNYALMAYNALTQTKALEIKEINETYQHIDFVRDVIYCGLVASHKVSKEEIDFTIDDVTIWVDEMDLSNIEIVIKDWTSSISSSEYIQKNLAALGDKEVKKKK